MYSIKKIEKDEMNGLNAMSLGKIEKQKARWSLKTEQEKKAYLETYQIMATGWRLNQKINFAIIYFTPFLLILILIFVGFKYKLY